MAQACCGLVPQVTWGAKDPASSCTVRSKTAPGSVRRSSQLRVASSQLSPVGQKGRPWR
ncbi:Uncharacterised protein [Mycobacteroides abscessus subsp. abscessus]|nr:Uncharacterised protein [Mycobacteroides abscessus subsp. abscessus]